MCSSDLLPAVASPVTSVSVTATPNPATVQAWVTMLATSSGSTSPRYHFWVQPPGATTWQEPCGGFRKKASCGFAASVVGNWSVRVDARDLKTISGYDATTGAVAVTVLPPPKPQLTVAFAERSWNVRGGFGGPGPNTFSNLDSMVVVDASGRLHLRVAKVDRTWCSTEVSLPTSLGYGTYEFTFASRVDQIDLNLVAAAFLYADDSHEYDIEFGRFKVPTAPNVDFDVQPWQTPGNQVQFTVNLAGTTSSIWRIQDRKSTRLNSSH